MHTRFGAGLLAGIIAGFVYGVLLQIVRVPTPMPAQDGPMIFMIGYLWNSTNLVVSWVYHLLVSGVFGIVFGLLVGREIRVRPSTVWGMVYGAVICLAIAYVIYPLAYEFGPYGFFVQEGFFTPAVTFLVGHLLYGATLGALYSQFRNVPAAMEKGKHQDRGSSGRAAA